MSEIDLGSRFDELSAPIKRATSAVFYYRHPGTNDITAYIMERQSEDYSRKQNHTPRGLLGGEHEIGESDMDALFRELREELPLNPELAGDVDTFINEMSSENIKLIHQRVLRPEKKNWWLSANNVYGVELTTAQHEALQNILTAVQNGEATLSDEVKTITEIDLDTLAADASAKGMSHTYEVEALIKLHQLIRNDVPALPLTSETITDAEGRVFPVVDTANIDWTNTVTAYKHAPRYIRVSPGDETIITVNSETGAETITTTNKGDLVFTVYDFDATGNYVATQDSYVPATDGIRWTAADLEAQGYYKIDDAEDVRGFYMRDIEHSMMNILPYAVTQPCVIKNAYGEGRHQFLQLGAMLKQGEHGRASGTNLAPFTRTWTILPKDSVLSLPAEKPAPTKNDIAP
ncbi:MAG: hypothetical protein GC136_06400 [Alphaproteobacteria bacterium]|nr:hypothetical protein [Alphaproteobacteria bacterium]